ncbi:MAG: AP2 domain-containing protein [Nitriliruptor sp.]|nr:MAG: AP2 domain-containing protein [Nitriliruptor sp.]
MIAMTDTPHRPTEAHSASTTIESEDGQWVVYLTVVFPDGIVRHEIQRYRSERQATIAARWFQRSADRDHGDHPL